MATSRDGSVVAYIGDRDAPYDSPAVIVRNLNTGQVWVEDPGVRDEDFSDMELRLSEDGSIIAVRVSLTTEAPINEFSVYRGAVGQPLRRIDGVCGQGCETAPNGFGLSRDGVVVSYIVDRASSWSGSFLLYNADSGTTVEAHPNSTVDDMILQPMLSGDGKVIAATYAWATSTDYGGGLVVKPLAAGRIVASDVLVEGDGNVDPQAMSRTGRVVVYSQIDDESEMRYRIYDLAAGGTTVTLPEVSTASYAEIRPHLDDSGGLVVWTLGNPSLDGVYAWRY
jgi:hypothetical protein